MYLMQEAGEPLRLRMAKGPYGPYAENLRHVLGAIDGYYVSGYGAGGDAPDKVLELVPGAVEKARATLARSVRRRAGDSSGSRRSWKGSSLRSGWSCSRRSTGSPRAREQLPRRT